MISPEQPKFSVHNVLIDMDWTITYQTKPPSDSLLKGLPADCYSLAILRDLLAKKRCISGQKSLEIINATCDPNRQCLFNCLAQIGIRRDEYWQVLLDYHKDNFAAYPDAVRAIKALHARGLNLYTASSNSRMAALSKLTMAGLADQSGSVYFAGFFGGDICEGGKTGPDFFRAILEKGQFDPNDVLMIGDDPEMDLASARAAGIEQVVLVCRTQEQPLLREEDGGWYVNSLDLVVRMIGE